VGSICACHCVCPFRCTSCTCNEPAHRNAGPPTEHMHTCAGAGDNGCRGPQHAGRSGGTGIQCSHAARNHCMPQHAHKLVSWQCLQHHAHKLVSWQCLQHHAHKLVSWQCLQHHAHKLVSWQCLQHHAHKLVSWQCLQHHAHTGQTIAMSYSITATCPQDGVCLHMCPQARK